MKQNYINNIKTEIHDIITTCIILHNMIIEDKRDLDAPIEVGGSSTSRG